MNLSTIRARILAARNWGSSGATFDEHVRQAVDTAYHEIAADAATVLLPDNEHLHLYGQVTNESTVTAANTARYLTTTTDTWVLQFTDSVGAPYIAPATGVWLPAINGTWDGVMHLEFQDILGKWHRRQSREWWTETNPAGEVRVYVSIDRPYIPPNNAAYYMTFRIYQPLAYCRSTARRILSVTPWDPSNKRPLIPLSQTSLLQQGLYDVRGDSTSDVPTSWSAGPDHQLPSPLRTPAVLLTTAPGGALWLGPHNPGTFKFAYTIVHGCRGTEWQSQPGGTVLDPMWESMPSTLSAAITNPTNKLTNAAQAIIINLPDIDFEMNFGDATTLRYSRTGLRKRIYVCISDIENSAPWLHPAVEIDGSIYYLLAEVDGSINTYTWQGDVIPDRLRRMPYSTGYSSIGVWPTNTEDTELDVRLERNPQPLMTDQDTPRLASDSFPAFLELCLYHLCLMDGVDMESAGVHLNNYMSMLGRVIANHATPGGTVIRRPCTSLSQGGLDYWRWSGGPARRSP